MHSRTTGLRLAPRHRGGLVDEVLDEAGQVPVHAVHVLDEELDDDGVISGRQRLGELVAASVRQVAPALPVRKGVVG